MTDDRGSGQSDIKADDQGAGLDGRQWAGMSGGVDLRSRRLASPAFGPYRFAAGRSTVGSPERLETPAAFGRA